MSQISHGNHNTRERGNTSLSLSTNNIRARRWCFTLNNYTDNEYSHIHTTFLAKKWVYVMGKEIGENNTPHIQGYVENKHVIDFNTLKKINNRWHLEKAKGSKEDNYKYCTKDNQYDTNIVINLSFKEQILVDEYSNISWKDWQENVLHKIMGPVDKRKILWMWEAKGNIGKSFLCKYICLKYEGVIIADGKKDNIFNQINNMLQQKMMPKIIILDVPRSNLDYVNYGAIEQIKNGCIYSGKYEGGVCLFKIPHVIIFANEQPQKDNTWSEDRFDVTTLR